MKFVIKRTGLMFVILQLIDPIKFQLVDPVNQNYPISIIMTYS